MTDNSNNHFNLHNYNDIIPRNTLNVTVHPTLTSIPDKTFDRYHLITSIIIPDSLTSIGDYAFSQCFSLKSVNVPNSVTRIGHAAFSLCSSLVSMNIPNSLTASGNYTFCGCSLITSISIPSSVQSIGNCAFCRCSLLTVINIPSSVISIGRGAFYLCSSLVLVVIPHPDIAIGFRAFDECDGLARRQANSLNSNAYMLTWLRERFLHLPLHQAIFLSPTTITIDLIMNLIHQHNFMLTSTDAMLMTPLHVLCCSTTVTAEMIQTFKDASSETASMRNVLGETPLMMYLKCKGAKYSSFHVDGQLLPLVDLLELGIKCDILEIILIFYDESMLASELEDRNETSGLMPFMLAGSLSQCGLDVMYVLAMKRPDILLNF
jgi:hypothetical protein